MLERVESILDLAESDEIGSFDEVEQRLVEEVRRLGGDTLEGWLERREEQVSESLREEKPGVQQREKNAQNLQHLRAGSGAGAHLALSE